MLHFSVFNAHFVFALSVVDFLLPLQYSSVKLAQNCTVLSEFGTIHQSHQCNYHSSSLVYHGHIRHIMCLKHDIVGLHCFAICDVFVVQALVNCNYL